MTQTSTPPSSPPKVARRFIADLRATGRAERITGPFSIANAQLGKTRSEKNYLRCLIGDKTGDMPGRMWTIEEGAFASLPTDGFVWIEGETQPYQGELQMIIHAIQVHEPSPDELHDLLPCAKRPAAEMFAELTALLDTLQHPSMKALAREFLADQPLMSAFQRCPAARNLHHAYLGGLLEHTLGLLKLADAVCPLYPRISRDLVMMGLFLHDIGKTRELVFDRTFAYSDRGELVGHIVDGVLMLRDKAHHLMRDQGLRFPRGCLMVLEHIILSHHGQPEFGAVKIPSTPEAILVSLLDNVDAKTTMALAAARPEHPVAHLGGNFTEKQWALSTKLYRPDPLQPPSPDHPA
ncbi:MAG: HD domain-containing protein [Phycisphaerales bacterium]